MLLVKSIEERTIRFAHVPNPPGPRPADLQPLIAEDEIDDGSLPKLNDFKKYRNRYRCLMEIGQQLRDADRSEQHSEAASLREELETKLFEYLSLSRGLP